MPKFPKSRFHFFALIPLLFAGGFIITSLDNFRTVTYNSDSANEESVVEKIKEKINPSWPAPLDKKDYDSRLLALANYVFPKENLETETSTDSATTTVATPEPILPTYSEKNNAVVLGKAWPALAPYPNGDAILPFKRILAYYGNFYSTRMGILGEYEPDEVLRRLEAEKKNWELADPNTPVMPAIEYIAMVAQADAGADGMYRAMMPDSEIDKAYEMAQKANAIMILDLQIGLSTVEREVPKFDKYMMRPDAHLALDPEFSMKSGDKPGTVIGTLDAKDINYTINHLSEIVRENKLPPKVLLVHRFTQKMVTNYHLIAPTPEVQVIMIMDGWGSKTLKRGTWSHVIEPEPVQFTGIKIFYKHDKKEPSTGLLTPDEVLRLNPKPIYVQYQ